MVTAQIYGAIQTLQQLVFVLLGVIAFRRWRSRGGTQRAWVFATFGLLAAVVIFSRLIPVHSSSPTVATERKLLIAVLVLFPYFLFRFTATFDPIGRTAMAIAHLSTAALVVWTLTLGRIPEEGQPRSPQFQIYVMGLLAYWTVLSIWVVIKLFGAGRDLPNVAKRRMQTLSLGTLALAAALIVSGSAAPSKTVTGVQLTTALLGLLSAPLFLLGFAPPRVFVSLWRRPDEIKLREAEKGLMKANTPEEVASLVLPHAAALFGAREAVLTSQGRVVGTWATDDAGGQALATAIVSDKSGKGPVWSPVGDGALILATSPYAPYFGREETEILGVLATLTDLALTRTRQAEELRAATEAMRDFVAIASHDLRTPITVIKGFALSLRANWDSMKSEDRIRHLDAINRHSDSLNRLVDDLLVLSRIESGNIQASLETLFVEPTVQTLLADMQATEFATNIEAGLTVKADASHFQRIVGNLVRNASVYGQVPFSVEAFEVDGMTQISVNDHGPGVPTEFEPRLFEKFARVDKQESKAHNGTGLGLSIVKGLVSQVGGQTGYNRVESRTTFWVRLPK